MTGKNIASKMLMQMIILAVLYLSATLLTAVKFLPDDALFYALPYPQISAFSHILLEMALLSGVIGAAIYVAELGATPLLTWTYRAWTLFLLLAGLAAGLDFLEGRYLLELPPVLDIGLVLLLCAFMIVVGQGDTDISGQGKYVWLVGMGFIVFAIIVSLLPVTNILADRVLRVFTVNMRFNVGYLLAGLAIVYWWPRQINLYLIAGVAAILGTLASLTPLTALGQSDLPPGLAIVIMLVCWIVLLREISRPGNMPHVWVNLGMMLFALSLGLLATMMTIPTIAAYVQGTWLTTLQLNLIAMSVLIFALGFAGNVLANRPILTAFWLVAVGLVGGQVALLLAGGAQTLMERRLSIGYLNVQVALLPLYVLWIIGLLVMGVGLVWFMLLAAIPAQTD